MTVVAFPGSEKQVEARDLAESCRRAHLLVASLALEVDVKGYHFAAAGLEAARLAIAAAVKEIERKEKS